MRARYRRWDGTQDPLGDELDVRDVLEELSDDLLSGLGADAALRRLLTRGLRGRAGLEELRRRLAAARARLEAELGAPLGDLAERLEDILATERAALEASDDDDARIAELTLDELPRHPAARIRALMDYRFRSPEAARAFAELVDELRRELLDAQVRGLSEALRSVGPEDIRRLTEMLAALNAMLEARARGEQPDFAGFMARYGDLFPEQPRDLDELLEVLARRMVATSRLLASLDPEQRRELLELARRVFDDLDLDFQLTRLADHLRALLPDLAWDEPFDGPLPDSSVPLSAAVEAAERLSELEELERAVGMTYAGARLEDIDEDALRRALGEDAVRDLRRLKRIERLLEESGVAVRRGGRLELTPRGARLLGERALVRLLDRIRREPATRTVGADPEPTGQTRPWRFGDTEPLAVVRTVHNAVRRRAAVGGPLRLHPDDLEVEEQEVRPRTATALLLDLSFSMPLKGHFIPAKRVALALHALITGRYRQDSLYLIGFSDYARRLQPTDLANAGFERVYGTNMQHAFLLARRLLLADPRPVKQVLMVTDGEPTAHLVGEVAEFNWPPVPETLTATLREAMRLARAGIRLHVFLLEEDPGLVAFAERLARVTGGEVVPVAAGALGRQVLGRYLRPV